MTGVCRICRREEANLSFEHVPPRAAFNDVSTTVRGFDDHPELGNFVLDRERTGLSDRYRFYLALYAGPFARTTGVVPAFNAEGSRQDTFVKVAWPPFAYVMTIDSAPEAIETSDITAMVDTATTTGPTWTWVS